MNKGFVAQVSVNINAPVEKVWDALVKPEIIKQYMFDTEVVTNWKEGEPIIWKGMWNGKPYSDKGVILKVKPKEILEYSHYSPLSGHPDEHVNYHTLTYELSEEGGHTHLSLLQDNNASEEEQEQSQKMWESMMLELKQLLEN